MILHQHPSASQDGIVVPTTLPSQSLRELTPAASATSRSEPPAKSTLSAPAGTELGNEAVVAHGDVAID